MDDFATVYATHSRWLYRYALALVSDPHVAEDIVADSFTRIYRPLEAGEVVNVRGYLRTTASNQAANHLRHRGVRRRFAARRTADHRGTVDPTTTHADRDELLGALDALTNKQRLAVVMRFYEQMDDGAIADVLGCSQATVRTHVSRGTDRLRAALDERERTSL